MRALVRSAFVVLGFAGIAGAARGAEAPELSADAERILLPLASEDVLDGGRAAPQQFRILVSSSDPGRGWVLYLRADQSVFRPEGAGKHCSDLRWKLDGEDPRAYRRLDENETIVLENPAGGDERVTLDVAVDLGWSTTPGTYGLGLVFRVAYL
jgi:hypothetical protein